METVVILSACRTPVGSFGGALKDLSAVDLGALVIRESITRAAIDGGDVGEVILGCVLQAGSGMNVARQASLKAGLGVDVPAETVNRVCGSGLQAVVHGAQALLAGDVEAVVAGGTESMSNAPYLMRSARWGARMGHSEVVDSMIADGLTCSVKAVHMGLTAEAVAERFAVTRADQDAFAAESQRRAGEAMAAGRFKEEIVPVLVPQKKGDPLRVDTDEYPRPGTTVEKLSPLKPAFKKDGTVTAGNASGINDGAAATVVMLESTARTRGLEPLARILSWGVVGVDPMLMGMAPVAAVRKALDRAKLTTKDIALFELNEAFAAQAVAVTRELGLDGATVNVNGGAIAIGHPIGASGARVLTTLIHALRARGGGRGVVSLCIGGGMGIAMVVETV